jgi:hypothetical protein
MASLKDKGWFCPVTRQYVNIQGAKVCATLNRLFASEVKQVAKAMPKRYYTIQ